jgi:hypothetical protein
MLARGRRRAPLADAHSAEADRSDWRMPALSLLSAPVVSGARKVGLAALRGYLAIAMILVIVKIILMAVGH